jgi:c-di-GMP-binding flagellar brake protein YcgR
MVFNKDEMPRMERRRYPRLDASVAIEYSIIGRAPLKETAFTKNIGAGGICLIVYEKIEVNTILSLKINLCDNSDIIEIKGNVVWLSEFSLDPDKKKRWDIGIEFTEINEEDRKRISKYLFRLLK